MEPICSARLLSHHALQDAFLRRREHRQPLFVEVEPTASCMLRCSFCPRDRLTRPETKLEFADLVIILKNLGEPFPASMLMFSGLGEPLIHPRIVSLVKEAKRAGWVCGLTTNGILLSERMAGELVAGLDVLQISLHATTEETHQQMAGGGPLADLVARIRSAVSICRERVVLALDYTMTPHNRAEMSAFASFWQREGIDCINFSLCHSRGGALLTNTDLQARRSRRVAWPCWCLRHALFISCQGELLACCNDLSGESRRGDLRLQRLDEILLQESTQGRTPPHEICKACDFSFRSPGSA